MIEAKIFKALGDPVRLAILNRLAQGSSDTIGKLTKNLGVSRQGARKQLQVLASANMVRLEPQGRETRVILDLATLQVARIFITNLESQWDQRLEALKHLVEDKVDK